MGLLRPFGARNDNILKLFTYIISELANFKKFKNLFTYFKSIPVL